MRERLHPPRSTLRSDAGEPPRERPPHSATIVLRHPPHAATVIQRRPPHPATIVPGRPAPASSYVKASHPATAGRERSVGTGNPAGAPDDATAVAQPFWPTVATAAAGYLYDTGGLATLAPGLGTVLGAAGGFAIARVGARLNDYFAETPEAKEHRETIEAAIEAYEQILDRVGKISVPATKSIAKSEVQSQVTSRIAKLKRLQQGHGEPNDDLDEVLRWAPTALASVRNLTKASLREEAAARGKSSDRDGSGIPEAYAYAFRSSTTALVFSIDDTVADLIAIRAARKPARDKPAGSSHAIASKTPPYALREAKTLREIEGEFKRWASDHSHIGVMFHSAYTIPNGPYSAEEKAKLRSEIDRQLSTWIKPYKYIKSAKVLSGKLGKGQNFNIGAYDEKSMVLNIHFIW